MANSPISGKSEEALINEAVDLGASHEDIQSSASTSSIVGDIQESVPADKHIPYGEEFDEVAKEEEPVDGKSVKEHFVGEDVERASNGPDADSVGPVTEEGKARALSDELIPPRAEGTYEATKADPAWWTSVGWSIQDYGVTGNLGRWTQQALDTPDPEATQQIQRNLEELTYGVSEEYHEIIAGQPTFEAAERESDRLRTQEYRDTLRANEGVGQALTAGVVGFILDPINLVPGAAILKGMNMSVKLATAAGMRGAAQTTVGKKAAAWGAASFTEELVRQAPRLASDKTFTADQYITEAAMGMFFGAAVPVVGAGARAVGRKIPTWAKEIKDTAEAAGVDQAFRSTAHTANKVAEQVAGADGGVVAKFKSIDLSKAIKAAKVNTKTVVDAQLRETRDLDLTVPMREAIDAADVTKVQATAATYLDKLINVITKRSKKDLTEQAEKTRQSMGAAKREETLATKVDDIKHDVRGAAKAAKRDVQRASEAARKLADEADLPADVRKNLEFLIERVRQQNEDAIDLALAARGERPIRTRMNNKDHTESVGSAFKNVRKAVSTLFENVGKSIEGLPKDLNMGKRGNAIMNKAYKAVGIKKQQGETWAAAFEREMKGKSHIQRKQAADKIHDSWNNNVQALKEELDARPDLTPTQVTALANNIDIANQQVNQQLDLARMLARTPFEDAAVTKPQWAQISQAWRDEGNMEELAKQFVDNKLQSAIKHQFGRLTESLASRLMKSEAPLAQWYTANILETPAGFGGKVDRNPLTAAIYAENLDNQARRPVLQAWEKMMKDTADAEGWSWLQRVHNKQGNARTHKDVTRLSKEVQLEMNARHFGTTSKASPQVSAFVDELDKGYQGLHDIQNGHVDGIHDGNKIANYQHQKWDDDKILDLIGTENGRKNLTDLFRQGYMNAGLDPDKAGVLAKAMVDQKAAAAARPKGSSAAFGEEDIAGIMPELSDVVSRLRKNGTSEDIITEIVDHINKAANGSTPGYAKSRVPIDLNAQATVAGQVIKVVDLMDNDVPAIFSRYSKEATARRAISESTGGVLNSDKSMNDMMLNMALEAQSLGANVDTNAVRNSLGMLMGRQYDGQLPMDVRRARDAVSLAGMGGLGESQLAEFGLAVNRGISGLVASMQKFRVAGANVNKKWRGIELTPEQATDKQFLSELQESAGLYGDMHLIDRRNVHLDAQEKNYKGLNSIVDTMTGGKYRPLLQHMQTRFTGYGVIRQFEDQIAMASLVQDMAKQFSGRKAFTSTGRFRDMGVDLNEKSWLAKRFKETVTYKEDGTVEQLNLNQWSSLDKNKLGVILNRYTSQQVQKGFVGESSPEMMNPWVSFMMQFKSYPMLAAEKQQARHLKFADKEAAMGTVLNAASSGAARMIRYQSMAASLREEDREAYLNKKVENDLVHDTFMYMGGVGMLVNNMDMFNSMVLGNQSVSDQLPVLNYIDNYKKAIINPTDRDGRNMQVAAPLGTIAQTNVLLGIMRNMMDDEE